MSAQTAVLSGMNSQPQDKGRKTNKQRKRDNKKVDGDKISSPGSDKPTEASTADLQSAAPKESQEDSLCWICAEPVKFYALSECNHRTCHVCAVRLRALYKKLECTFCKLSQDLVLFTSSPDTPFVQYEVDTIPFKDSKLAIVFETQEMMEETLILLRFNCPDPDCTYVASGWNDLKLHVRAMHGKVMCDLCIRFKKVFAHEHALYLPNQLYEHLPSINHRPHKNGPKAKVEGGVHPLCEFCQECFFGDDELFSHMRDRHEDCFICKRNDIRDKYFLDYEHLENHFINDHHPCRQSSCLSQKFVVFGSAMDLQAHIVEEHGGNMTARDKKDARRVIADFSFEDAGLGSADRRRRRDRDHELPSYQSGATQTNTLNRRREGFGATLTTSNPSASEINNPPPEVQASSRRQSPSPVRAEADPITAERHSAFLSRVAALTANSSSAISAIKASIVSFRASESTARDLISTLYNVLKRDLDATASLIVTLIDLLDNEEKRSDLLQSWNGFKIEQRREFPDLAPGAVGTGYAGVASGRVLNVKHSTGSRSSQQSTRQVWDRVARAAALTSTAGPSSSISTARPSDIFPSIKPASSTHPISSFRQPQHKTPWVSSSSQTPSKGERAGPQVSGQNELSIPPPLSNAAFPTLPSSSAARQKPTVSGNRSLQNIVGSSGPPPIAWRSIERTQNSGLLPDRTVLSVAAKEEARKGKKKKGKEKQTLFTLGSFPN